MKRGSSGLSLVVGIDKPEGLTSHDVVSRCRRIFGERRVGHTGTLDPLATGALLVCVGPATRLDAYLVDHDKRYRVRVAFGAGTDTDDALGTVTQTAPVPAKLFDEDYARRCVAGLEGRWNQLPPVYSALKVGGRKACDEARAGRIVDLAPRAIEVYEAHLLGIDCLDVADTALCTGECSLLWDIEVHVSKGTYIRSLARDLGRSLGCPAHVSALRRLSVGALAVDECVTLETLEQVATRAALDPVALLGARFAFVDGPLERRVSNGGAFAGNELALCEMRYPDMRSRLCACTSGVCDSKRPAAEGETVAVVSQNRLAALYEYDAANDRYHAKCVFSTGVSRGEYL